MPGEENVLSTVFGGVSIGCWIVVYSPQIIENYRLKSGEGLSVLFVVVWLLGDLCNLIGAIIAGLIPTVIILALYYTVCDIILLFQIYFYRWEKRRSDRRATSPDGVTEESPLVGHTREGNVDPNHQRLHWLFAQYAGGFLFVLATGIVSWWISARPGGTPQKPSEPGASELTIQLIGWTSAILYLGARVPQIFKNFETKCEGLSPGLFIFAITGNATYALSITTASMQRDYLVRNGSWLAGSALTIFFDVFVLCQFFYYRSRPSRECGHGVITEL